MKRRGGRLTPKQQAELAAIERAGGIALVVTSVEEVAKVLDPLCSGRPRQLTLVTEEARR